MKKAALAANYFKMVTSTVAAIAKTKNTVKDLSIGSTCVSQPVPKRLLLKYSSITEAGGEDCRMERENPNKLTVKSVYYKGDYYVGSFKNGLKHGEGK